MISPLYGQLSPLRVPTRAARMPVSNSDAEAYLIAVETADASQLEQVVADAINDFVVGCKLDGIWSAIKASCIMAGAQTISGALVPLVGTAPTNNNFVQGDYNRKTGLIGDGTTKFINTNRNGSADPRNSKHNSVWMSQHSTRDIERYAMGAGGSAAQCNLFTNASQRISRINNGVAAGVGVVTDSSTAAGFWGASRGATANFLCRYAGTTTSFTVGSSGTALNNHGVFSNVGTGGASFNGRISFYSIGENIDLTKLDARLTILMTALDTALP